MGKDGFMTPKAIATRIKAKGLQRLRWYCQLCEKQCRDENGFKCHQTSDAHRRNMDIFGQSAGKVVYEYSRDFEKAFMDHLKRAHPFTRVLAKNVYNEYINDKHHIHMNSTRWVTLTEFVKYLGKEGKCKVDETEKGWWITLIMKDPMQEIEDEKKLKRTVAEKEEQDRHLTEVNAQVARARKAARLHEEQDTGPSGGDILIKTDDAPLVLSLAPSLPGADEDPSAGAGGSAGPSGPRTMGLPPRAPGGLRGAAVARPKAAFGDDEDDEDNGVGPSKASGAGPSKGGSKLDEMMKKEKEAKARHQAELASSSVADRPGGGPWLAEGIVVKVMSKELERHGYYKKKGVVDKVIDKYVGEIAMLDSGDVVRVDQAQLETVTPQPGGQVLMVAGPHKGFRATLKEIDTDRFRALVKLGQGPRKGDEVWADYEAMSKLAS